MPPKAKPAGPSKKTELKKKEKVIEVGQKYITCILNLICNACIHIYRIKHLA